MSTETEATLESEVKEEPQSGEIQKEVQEPKKKKKPKTEAKVASKPKAKKPEPIEEPEEEEDEEGEEFVVGLEIEQVLSTLSQVQQLRMMGVLKSISDIPRIKILEAASGNNTVTAICDIVGQSQPAVSHHLRICKDVELIEKARHGKKNYYKLTDRGVVALEAVRAVAKFLKDE